MAMELTGAPSLARGAQHVGRGEPGEAIPELLMGGLGALGMATLPYGGGQYAAATRRPMGLAPRVPRASGPTRIYRGINQAPDAERAAMLGDRWWHTNPEVASTYAPGADGAHVMPGVLDEGALNMARIDAPPGTNSRSIPVEALPRDIRRALPRGATHANTHEVAAAAEAAGYDGISFGGIRDSGYGGAMETYPGFNTGDAGRTVTVFRDNAVRSPFNAAPSPLAPPAAEPPVRPPPRLPGRATDGSVLPVRPREPIRNSLRGGSDDLMSAARSGPDAGGVRASELPDGGGAQVRFEDTARKDGYHDLASYPEGSSEPMGNIEYFPTNAQTWRVNYSTVDPALRGQRQGVALYEELVRRARDAGVQRLDSDITVTTDAARVYDALQRRGYAVTRNPLARQGGARGEWITADESPVFRIELNPTRTLPNAGPPRPPPQGPNR